MALLDVNVLVALVWDSHVHHVPARAWFTKESARGWVTSPVTEAGFVRVSANPKVLPSPVSVVDAIGVLRQMRSLPGHRFVVDDVSITHDDVPALLGHRQVTDAQLLTLARRQGLPLVTFDAGIASLASNGDDVILLQVL